MPERRYATAAERQRAYRARRRTAEHATLDPAQCSARVLRNGGLTVCHCPDGRTLLWLNTAWLELRPTDRAWLVAALTHSRS